LLAAGLLSAAACDPLGTNNTSPDVASISDLILPSPSVVVGEIMRDSSGVEAPVTLNAYDRDGRLLVNQTVSINVLDASVTIDQSRFVHGVTVDTVGARVIAGAGSLQTQPVRIPVSVHPDFTTTTVASSTINFPIPATDSTSNANWSVPLDLLMTGNGSRGAQGFIVKYSIIKQPAGLNGAPTVYLIDGDPNRPTSRDTTSASGHASRRVVIRSAQLANIAKTDTIVVRATASYAGLVIGGLPIDFTIQIKKTP
jgi:hypothetical protein